MIKIVYRSQIDTETWDNFIEQSLQRNIYVSSWFLDLIPKDWGAVIKFNQDMNYVAVLPFQIRSKYGIKIVDQDPATKELGLYSLLEVDPEELLEALKNEFRYISKYYFNTENGLKYFTHNNFKVTYQLSLDNSYHVLSQKYNHNRKRNLKRAKAKKQFVVESENIDTLVNIFKENVAHKIYGLKNYQYNLLKKLYTETKKKDLSFLLSVTSQNGEVYSSALFIKSFNRLIYFFSATTKQGRENGSQTLLLDYVIQKFSQSDLILDFEGGSIEGIGSFYSGFGAKVLKIYSLQQKRMPFIIKSLLLLRGRIIKNAIQFYQRKLKRI